MRREARMEFPACDPPPTTDCLWISAARGQKSRTEGFHVFYLCSPSFRASAAFFTSFPSNQKRQDLFPSLEVDIKREKGFSAKLNEFFNFRLTRFEEEARQELL